MAGAFPDRQLVYTNAVYVNPDEKACFTSTANNYVQLNDLAVFIVQYAAAAFIVNDSDVCRPNAAVKKGEIALTMPQKAACKVAATGSNISVKARLIRCRSC